MSYSFKPISFAFCFSAIFLSLSFSTVMPSSAQESPPFLLTDMFPASNGVASPAAQAGGSDEPTGSELVPEAVEAIKWLNDNFGKRVQKDNLDWLASVFGNMDLDDEQLLSVGRRIFGLKRGELIQAVQDASKRNENLEFYVGGVFTPDQEPTLVCLRDGELFVIPVADRYCELTGLRRQDISIIYRRQRFHNCQLMLTLNDLQSSNSGMTEQGKMSLELKFKAGIDQQPGTDKLQFVTEFWQGEKGAFCFTQMDTPSEGDNELTGATIWVEFAGGELEPGKPVLVFVTAIQSTDSPVADFPGKTTRISNSLVRALEVPGK